MGKFLAILEPAGRDIGKRAIATGAGIGLGYGAAFLEEYLRTKSPMWDGFRAKWYGAPLGVAAVAMLAQWRNERAAAVGIATAAGVLLRKNQVAQDYYDGKISSPFPVFNATGSGPNAPALPPQGRTSGIVDPDTGAVHMMGGGNY